ncbi:hypothetical protein [Burkholderia ubonensis]|uniref:hypothetical protein n=1 Tax=Burkholderia ubonensis TaxID=101571 RepID=UPI002AAF6124|nr:hypothetical protein [Burkholderia ubonensis]
MTFFANSGVAWPKVEYLTRDAGTRSLDAASQIWKLLADLEALDQRHPEQSDIFRCVQNLELASKSYYEIANLLGNEMVSSMTPAEIELAAVTIPPRYAYYPERFFYPNDRFYDLFLGDGDISVAALYREMAQRMSALAIAIRTFDVDHDERANLAPQAFQMMKQWEMLATLGRIIAVLGRRSG